MKISQKSLEYILLLLIVAVALGAYRFGYSDYMEKADAARKENKEIEARIEELQDKLELKEVYEQAIEEGARATKEILSLYGPGNTPEKSIMMVTDLQNFAGMDATIVTFNPDELIYASSALNGEGMPIIEGYRSQLGITYSTDYNGLKKCMDFITGSAERMNVSSLSAVYNQETGGLSGSMILNLYSIKDADHSYEEPVVSGIGLGVSNIFGTK